MADASPVVRLERVKKAYGVGSPVEVEVLHGIDLELKRVEFVALTGPSGSGKSTLLNIIGLLDRPTSGRLFIEGRETSGLNDTELTKITRTQHRVTVSQSPPRFGAPARTGGDMFVVFCERAPRHGWQRRRGF